MNNHGLGHLPQPDNFTTVGNKLGIEINQYNCPINVGIVQYSAVQYSPVQYSTTAPSMWVPAGAKVVFTNVARHSSGLQ